MDADIPAESGAEGGLFRATGGAAGLLRGLTALGPTKLAALGAVAVSVLGLLAVLVWHGNVQSNTLLYGNLELRESSQIADALDHAHIPYQLQDQGARILVPPDQVAKARMLLARDGLPTGGSVGYELFDHADPLTMTQFQQSLDETRALEGELERSIRSISGVRAARVHLVLPRREPFERTERTAQASVLLTMTPGARLDQQAVQAILNLIAAAVPGLRPENISMVDTSGSLLARAGRPTGEFAMAQTVEELRHNTEERISRAVEDLLQQTVGAGHVRAEANVDLDTSQLKETQESYNPDQQVARSTQTVNENNKSTEATPTVSVQNNLPNADAGTSGAGSQNSRQEETTNYEIGKTVRTLVRDTPQLRRISVAVMVDGEMAPDKDGKLVWHERTQQDLDRIAALVRSAIGYDEKRGDHVEVVSMRFAGQQDSTEPQHALPLGLERADIPHLITSGLFGLVAVLALLLVVRPLALRLTASPPMVAGGGAAGTIVIDPQTGEPRSVGTAVELGSAGQSVQALSTELAANGDDSLINMSKVEGQVRASSLRRTAALAEKHPEETLSILRAWMAQSEAT